uniref:NADAR domain-containing protein n=1 Tax=Caenorhabditis japonica TaxID=281687 RepID=A0A8R1HQN1_CAEJA
MENPINKDAENILDTKDLSAALPDVKPEHRPKYVQILQDKSGPRSVDAPNKSPVGLNASSSATDSPPSKDAAADKKPVAKPKSNRNFKKNGAAPNGKRPFRLYLKKQEVVAIPSDLKTRELSISPENVLFFSGPGNYLSALYPSKLVVDGNEYNSVEHYYQACKLYTLINKEAAAELKAAATPIEVKKATKDILKGKVTSQAVSEWKMKDSFAVLKYAITQKFVQNEELKLKLLETGDKILIQTYIGDNFFAVGAGAKYTSVWVTRHLNQSLKVPEEVSAENFKYLPLVAEGKNALGWILMQVRQELRSQSQ